MPVALSRGETLVDVFSTISSIVNPNLVINCSVFNAANYTQFGGSGGTGPSYSNTLVADPNGNVDAQQVTFTDPRCGFYQILNPTLTLNTTYTVSIYYKLISGTPNFFLGYYNGANSISQYSPKIIPTVAWQRASFTFFTGINGTTSPGATAGTDPNPSAVVTNANVDLASQGNDGVVALWGMKVEIGAAMTTFNGCQTTLTGRQWLLGWYTFGTTQNPTPTTALGFAPDGGDYDSSGEDHGVGGGWACLYAGAANFNPTVLFVAIDQSVGLETGGSNYAAAAAGNFDTQYQNVIANAQSQMNASGFGNIILFVRIDPEFNLNNPLNAGGIDPTVYKNAWNRCASFWKAQGFKTCWNPSATQAGDARGAVSAYFPGATGAGGNCDLVGLDVYTNVGIGQTASLIIGNSTGVGTLEWYKAQNFGNLPICFPEWGDQYNSTDVGTGDGSQMTAIINWMNGLGSKFVYAGWWNGEGAGHKIGSVGISVMQNLIKNNYSGTYWPLPLKPTQNFVNFKP